MENQENKDLSQSSAAPQPTHKRLSLVNASLKPILVERDANVPTQAHRIYLKRKLADRESLKQAVGEPGSSRKLHLVKHSAELSGNFGQKRRKESSASSDTALAALERVLGPFKESKRQHTADAFSRPATRKTAKAKPVAAYPSPSSSFSFNNSTHSFQQSCLSAAEKTPPKAVRPVKSAACADVISAPVKTRRTESKNDPLFETLVTKRFYSGYEEDFIEYLWSEEPKYCPNGAATVRLQTEVSWEHRAVLINWLASAHYRFSKRKSSSSLYLAVNILDRFLQSTFVSLSRFHMAGVAALLVASKAEDVDPLTAEFLSKATNYTVAKSWILAAEKAILDALQWRINVPQPSDFIACLAHIDLQNALIAERVAAAVHMSHFVFEMSLFEESLFECPYSLRAAGSYYLSLAIFQQLPVQNYPTAWTDKHTRAARYAQPVIFQLSKALISALVKFHTPVPSSKALLTDKRYEELDCPGAIWRKYANYSLYPCVNRLGPSKLVERVLKFSNYLE